MNSCSRLSKEQWTNMQFVMWIVGGLRFILRRCHNLIFINSSDRTNVDWRIRKDLEGNSISLLEILYRNLSERTEENDIYPQDIQCSCRDSKQAPAEYESIASCSICVSPKCLAFPHNTRMLSWGPLKFYWLWHIKFWRISCRIIQLQRREENHTD